MGNMGWYMMVIRHNHHYNHLMYGTSEIEINMPTICIGIHRWHFRIFCESWTESATYNMYIILKRRVRSLQSQVLLQHIRMSLLCLSFIRLSAYDVPGMFWEHENVSPRGVTFRQNFRVNHRKKCSFHGVILIESRNVLVIDVITICDWFASDCVLSRVVYVSDIMSHDSYCITCFTIGYIAFLTISNQWNTSCIFPIEFIRRFVRNG